MITIKRVMKTRSWKNTQKWNWGDLYKQPLMLWRGKIKKKTLWPLFYGWGSTPSGLEPIRGDSLLFTTKQLTIKIKNVFKFVGFAQ